MSEKKRSRSASIMRWSKEKTNFFLQIVADKVRGDCNMFEKPTAAVFYKKIIEDYPSLSCYSWSAMRDKIRNLKLKYREAIDWRKKTGQGVLENSGEQSVREYILKICPYFDTFDEIFGMKSNINIGYIFESEKSGITETDQEGLEKNMAIEYEYVEDKLEPDQSIECEQSLKTSIEDDSSLNDKENEVPTNFTTFKQQLAKSVKKKPCHTQTNSSIAFLTKLYEERTTFNKGKLENQINVEQEKLKLEKEKLEKDFNFKTKQLEVEKEKIALEKERMQEDIKLKMLELEYKKEIELKKFEIEMKFKYNNSAS